MNLRAIFLTTRGSPVNSFVFIRVHLYYMLVEMSIPIKISAPSLRLVGTGDSCTSDYDLAFCR